MQSGLSGRFLRRNVRLRTVSVPACADTDDMMQMELELFGEMLEMESTSGTERAFAEFLENKFPETEPSCRCVRYEVGDGTLNLLFRWDGASDGMLPKVLLGSHLDSVPPYIPPKFSGIAAGSVLPDGKHAESDDILITGRGSCDAKGQIFSMWSACRRLAAEGFRDFGLLLLSGEETGSFGAKAFDRDCPGSEWIIVGEPTDNEMVSASKGTKAFNVAVHGKACHSGYPELGFSAVDGFIGLVEKLKNIAFPADPELGATTWNIGALHSPSPQNILSPLLTCRIYFRTTFASDVMVQETMAALASENIEIEPLGGDTPMRYSTFEGYAAKPVAFGSDTPRLSRFGHRSLCGPGSIFVAHTPDEYVLAGDLEKACAQYVDMVERILGKLQDLK